MSASKKNTTYTIEEMKRMINQAIQHLQACKISADFITKKSREAFNNLHKISKYCGDPCEEQTVIGKYIVEAGYGKLFTTLWQALYGYVSTGHLTGNWVISRMLVTYINFTDFSPELGIDFGRHGQVHVMVKDLKSMMAQIDQVEQAQSVRESRTKAIGRIVAILYNVIRLCDKNRQIYRTENVLATCKECMHMELSDQCIKIDCLLILAYVVDEEESRLLETHDGGVAFLLNMLKKAVKSDNHRDNTYSATELVQGLNRLAVNDAIKVEMEKQGCIPDLIRMLESDFSEKEQQVAAEALWNLSFEDSIRNSDQLQMAIKPLERLATSCNKDLQRACASALWQIKGGVRHNTGVPQELPPSYQEAMKEPVLAKSDSTQIMVSYQWDSQPTALQVRDGLVAAGYKVWMDVTNMRGDILASMADAVENSDIILICMTERYKESRSCRSEATYAYKLEKNVIPLLLENGYKPDGWLGLLQGMDLYYELHSDHQIQASMENLIKAIKERTLTGKDAIDGPITMSQQDVCGSSPGKSVPAVGAVGAWSTDDVQDWLRKSKLSELCETLDFCDGSQLEVLYDQYCQNPKEFMDDMKSDYQMSAKMSLMFAGALKKLFKK